MLRRPFHLPLAAFLAVLFATSLLARGQVWTFLGYTRLDGNRDHGKIEITRPDRLFRTIQLRVTGDAIFVDRFVVHFGDGASQEFVVSGRISPEGREYLMEFPGKGKEIECIELWYFKESWEHNPRVSLYGIRLPEIGGETVARQP